MPKAPHTLRSPAALGINEASRPELVEFGSANLRQENIRQFLNGEAATRYGFGSQSLARFDATTSAAGYKMFADRGAVVRITDTLQAEAFSCKAQAWEPLGRVPECAASLVDTVSMGTAAALEDVDYTNGYIALSWLTNTLGSPSSAYLAIVDRVTGATVRAPELIGTSTDQSPALLAVQGNYFISVRWRSGPTTLEAWYLDTTSAATISAGWVAFGSALCTDTNAADAFVVVHSLPHASTPRVAVLYRNASAGANRLTLLTVNVGGVVETKTINTSSVTPGAIALGGNATDTLWVAWSETVSLKVCGLSPFAITASALASTSLIETMAVAADYIGIVGTSTGKARVWGADTTGLPRGQMRGVQTSSGAAATDGAQVSVQAVKMRRKPFYMNGRVYSMFDGPDSGNSQNNAIVCDWTSDVTFLRPVATFAPGLSPLSLYGRGKFVQTGAYAFAVGVAVQRSGLTAGSAYGVIDFASTSRWRSVAHGSSTFLSGGLLSYYDGVRVAEAGFLLRPATPTTGLAAGAISGTFRYVAVFEEVDANGNVCVSGLSAPSASVSPAAQSVTVTTSPLTITGRMSAASSSARSVRVAWYRTATGGLAPYYRLGTTTNDTTATTVTFSDNIADTVLTTKAVLYSQPGVLGTSQDRRPPPFFNAIVSYNGMLVGASGSDVWFSGQNVAGEATWFNPLFQVPVPGAGDITAFEVMDGTLYAFKRREVFAIVGDPPSDNGASGGLGLPRRMACDVGCIDPRSTCTTALGIFFQSERGVEVLTRAQTVQWIGQPIQQTLASYPVVTSITVVPSMSGAMVYVECAASESAGLVTGSGRTLVFDMATNSWVSTDIRTSVAGIAGAPSQSACIIYTGTSYRYAWMATDGRVHYEDRTTHLDANGSFVVPLIETAYFNAAQRELRVRTASILFQRYTAAGITVESAYDNGDYQALDSAVWSEVDTLGERQLEIATSPRGETVKFRITATQPVALGTGQGFGFIGLALDVDAEQGPVMGTLRIDPAKRR